MDSIEKVRSQHKYHTKRYHSASGRSAVKADLQVIVHFDFVILKLHPILLPQFLAVGQLQIIHLIEPVRHRLFWQLWVLFFSSLERKIVLCVS